MQEKKRDMGKRNIVEILWRGRVHYRRPEGDSTVIEAAELIEKGNTLYSLRRCEEGQKKEPAANPEAPHE